MRQYHNKVFLNTIIENELIKIDNAVREQREEEGVKQIYRI